MKCPVCAAEMDEHVRDGAKISHCPACGGVWLDRGELDHLMAAIRPPVTLQKPRPPRPAPAPPPEPDVPHGKRDTRPKAPKPVRFEDRERESRARQGRSHRYGRRYSRKRQLKNVLDEIFDFD